MPARSDEADTPLIVLHLLRPVLAWSVGASMPAIKPFLEDQLK
jgi:hypothetical protein